MAKTEVKRDFKVLAEKISPENVLVMSELLAIKETKTLTRFMGSLAEKAHKKLCCDVFLKDLRGYVLSDCYDMVQSVAAFLCEHFGEYLDDFLYISNRGKRISIKVECYLIIERALCGRYRTAKRCISLERVQAKLQYIVEEDKEEVQPVFIGMQLIIRNAYFAAFGNGEGDLTTFYRQNVEYNGIFSVEELKFFEIKFVFHIVPPIRPACTIRNIRSRFRVCRNR